MVNLRKLFEKNEDLCRFYNSSKKGIKEFRKVANGISRPDLYAMYLLDKLQPYIGEHSHMIWQMGHEQIALSINCKELEKIITEKEVIKLIKCGIQLNVDDHYEDTLWFCV